MKRGRKIFGYFLFKARSIPGPGEPGMAEDEWELTHRTQHTRPFSSLTEGTVYAMRAESTVLPHNGGFCNGCITKRIQYLSAFPSQK
jgi:hypothetical protein